MKVFQTIINALVIAGYLLFALAAFNDKFLTWILGGL